MPKLKIVKIKSSELTEEQWLGFGSLVNEAFPKEGVSDQQRVDSARQKVKGDEVFVLVFSEDNSKEDVVASAVCFKRRIITSCGELDILALASVAVRKSMRGQGLGVKVVRECFGRVDSGEFPVALFQTNVAGFYTKLGARCIQNRVINSLGEDKDANPFWGENLMIYPAGYKWPDGVIDLLGEGY